MDSYNIPCVDLVSPTAPKNVSISPRCPGIPFDSILWPRSHPCHLSASIYLMCAFVPSSLHFSLQRPVLSSWVLSCPPTQKVRGLGDCALSHLNTSWREDHSPSHALHDLPGLPPVSLVRILESPCPISGHSTRLDHRPLPLVSCENTPFPL